MSYLIYDILEIYRLRFLRHNRIQSSINKHKITVVESAKSHIKNYTQLFEFDLKIYISGKSRWVMEGTRLMEKEDRKGEK